VGLKDAYFGYDGSDAFKIVTESHKKFDDEVLAVKDKMIPKRLARHFFHKIFRPFDFSY